MVKVNSWELRTKRGSSSQENSNESVNGNKSSSTSPDEEVSQESQYSVNAGRVTRRNTRNNSRAGFTDGASENGSAAGPSLRSNRVTKDKEEEDTLGAVEEAENKAVTTEEEMSSTASSDNDEESNVSDELKGIQIRRSRRQRVQKYPSYDESWIIGGGPAARGYPRRSEHLEDRRRSGRLLENPKIDFSALGNGNVDDGNDSEDMYSRVKKRRTSFNGGPEEARQDGRRKKRSRSLSLPSQQDEEPVSRRLRDRNKLTMSGNSNNGVYGSKPSNIEMYLRKRRFRKRRRDTSASSSSSSSDSDAEARSPSKKRVRRHHMIGGTGPSFGGPQKGEYSKKEMLMLMEVQPIAVDPNISFKSVGGLDHFINKMKEIVLFPLLYSDFYEQKCMRPPRGILLHGPPGTGKTLMARALANECSNINGKKVSFFLRKGADLLNKFIGESERQLRMLFQQAAHHQPSIIFFDEIDGLAPVRSAKSDQIHNSIVSTLLAELDGLQDRGQIIVIGSTNRLDFIDPALRRPGRFDCELPIFLPTRDGRLEILKVHVSKWKDIVPNELMEELADRCIGFTGADLKSLCWNASMNSLRRTYPQIYGSSKKYLLNYGSIKVERDDWELAVKSVAPSTTRSLFSKYSPAQPLPTFVKPLLESHFNKVKSVVDLQFPYQSLSLMTEASRKRLVICADPDTGLDTYIVPAILHTMETLPVRVLSHEALHMDGFGVEFALTQICMEVLKQSSPSILYIPALDRLINLLSESAKEVIIRMMSQSVQKPVFIIATIQEKLSIIEKEEMNDDEIMKPFKGCFLRVEPPSKESVRNFFQPVFEQALQVKKKKEQNDIVVELPLAPPESPSKKVIAPEQLRALEKRESATFRQLRIFLREILSKLARNKKFEEFTKPVDTTDAPDYLTVISNPMDLETMMFKLNMGEYLSAAQFLSDIKLISNNCLEYNPHRTDCQKRLRMRAYELVDFANTLIENEMDSDFEDHCQEIIKNRAERNAPVIEEPLRIEDQHVTQESTSSIPALPVTSTSGSGEAKTPDNSQSPQARPTSAARKKKKKSPWSRGTVRKPIKKKSLQMNGSQSPAKAQEQDDKDLSPKLNCSKISESEQVSPIAALLEAPPDDSKFLPLSMDLCDEESSSSTDQTGKNGNLSQNETRYRKALADELEKTVELCKELTVVDLIDLRFQLVRIVETYQYDESKEALIQEIKSLLSNYAAQKSLHSLLQSQIKS